MATLGTEGTGHRREAALVERWKRVNVWTVPPKNGRYRDVAVVE